MAVALFILYLVGLSFAAAHSRFLRSSKLSPAFLASLFILYSAVGCLHVWIAYHFYPGHGDIWNLFDISVQMKQELTTNPQLFFKNFLPDNFSIDLTGKYSRWSYLQYDIMASVNIFFNFLSADNLYINTILFCFVTLWGKAALFNALAGMSKGKHILSALLAFIVPSVIFWTGVVHKEGVLFTAIGILAYSVWRLLQNKAQGSAIINDKGKQISLPGARRKAITKNIRYIFAAAVCIAIIFLLRKILLISLLPALAIWAIAEKTAYRKRYIVIFITAASLILLWLLAQAHQSFDILFQMSDRQLLFQQLEGGSRMELPLLHNNWQSLLSVFPYAFINGLFMPLPGSGGQTIYSLFSLELILIWAIILYGIYYGMKKRILQWTGFKVFCLYFSLSACLLTGYIIPFAGAIIRYRSIFYPFLLIPFVGVLQYHPRATQLNRWLSRAIIK